MVRGLKSLIAKTSPGKLVKAKHYPCYRAPPEAAGARDLDAAFSARRRLLLP